MIQHSPRLVTSVWPSVPTASGLPPRTRYSTPTGVKESSESGKRPRAAKCSRNRDAAIGGHAVCFSPDGRYLVVGGYNLAAFVWRCPPARPVGPCSVPIRHHHLPIQTTMPPIRPGRDAGAAVPVVQLLFDHTGRSLTRSVAKHRVRTPFPIAAPSSPLDHPEFGTCRAGRGRSGNRLQSNGSLGSVAGCRRHPQRGPDRQSIPGQWNGRTPSQLDRARRRTGRSGA